MGYDPSDLKQRLAERADEYASKAQQGKFHAMEARGEISPKVVKEFDKASKGKMHGKPEHVKQRGDADPPMRGEGFDPSRSSEMVPPTKAATMPNGEDPNGPGGKDLWNSAGPAMMPTERMANVPGVGRLKNVVAEGKNGPPTRVPNATTGQGQEWGGPPGGGPHAEGPGAGVREEGGGIEEPMSSPEYFAGQDDQESGRAAPTEAGSLNTTDTNVRTTYGFSREAEEALRGTARVDWSEMAAVMREAGPVTEWDPRGSLPAGHIPAASVNIGPLATPLRDRAGGEPPENLDIPAPGASLTGLDIFGRPNVSSPQEAIAIPTDFKNKRGK